MNIRCLRFYVVHDSLRIAKQLGNRVEEARAYSNLGSSHHFRRNFERAIAFHNHVLHIAQELNDKTIEARAYAGLGHAARCMSDYVAAKRWHERQLDMALSTRDKVAEGRACSNLGIVYQLLGDHDAALKLHQVLRESAVVNNEESFFVCVLPYRMMSAVKHLINFYSRNVGKEQL